MKNVQITPTGAMIAEARTKIPELAKVTLDRYSNNKIKELKLATRALKYRFPFYESYYIKRAFNKIFDLIDKALKRNIPYIEESKVPFIQIPLPSQDGICVRIGPYDLVRNPEGGASLVRYVRYLTHLITKYSIPISISLSGETYVKPKDGTRYSNYSSDAERRANTYQVLQLHISLMRSRGEQGYLLLHHAESLIKIAETLHRKAHYADSTYRGTI